MSTFSSSDLSLSDFPTYTLYAFLFSAIEILVYFGIRDFEMRFYWHDLQ